MAISTAASFDLTSIFGMSSSAATTEMEGDAEVSSIWKKKKSKKQDDSDTPEAPLPTMHGGSMGVIFNIKNLVHRKGEEDVDDHHLDLLPQYYVDAYNQVKVKGGQWDIEYHMESMNVDRDIDIPQEGGSNDDEGGPNNMLRGIDDFWSWYNSYIWGTFYATWKCRFCESPTRRMDGDDWYDGYDGYAGGRRYGCRIGDEEGICYGPRPRLMLGGEEIHITPLDFVAAMQEEMVLDDSVGMPEGVLGRGNKKTYNQAVEELLCENLRKSGNPAYKHASECEITYTLGQGHGAEMMATVE